MHRVYTVADLQAIFDISANTVSNWVKAGMTPSDSSKPYVFRGKIIKDFHKNRKPHKTRKLSPGEILCKLCKVLVFPDLATAAKQALPNGAFMLIGGCPECGRRVHRIASQADLDLLESKPNPKTPEECLHEEVEASSGEIGKCVKNVGAPMWTSNDRTIFQWQIYAGRLDEKTIDAHLAAIRFCEVVTKGKVFRNFTQMDVSKVREALKSALLARDENQKSKSSVSHTVSHLVAFFEWLLKQDGFKRLPADLPDYFRLPRAAYSRSLPRKAKDYASIAEAEELLERMPSLTRFDLRARAIFALAYLGALRADTLISLRLKHFDVASKAIVQDATVVRAKNGKSLTINWFPIPDRFSAAVLEWTGDLETRGFSPEDAMFPNISIISAATSGSDGPVLPMTTKHAVSEAFSIACRNQEIKLTPHSAKHTIAALRDTLRLTSEQNKAWCENMGHENESITVTHYGKLSEERRSELFEDIATGETGTFEEISDAAKIALFDEFLAKCRGQ